MSKRRPFTIGVLVLVAATAVAVAGCDRDDAGEKPEATGAESAPEQQDDDTSASAEPEAPVEQAEPEERADQEESEEETGDEDEAAHEEQPDDKTAQQQSDDEELEPIQAFDTPEEAFELMQQQSLDPEFFDEVALWRLQLLRNAPFARAGHEFSTPWLEAYFWRQPGVYEPGGFDDDELTDRERDNVGEIRAYEDELSDDELQSRWEALWDSYEMDPPEGSAWEVPGPWQNIEDRIEARLIAELLDVSHPDDPLFDADATRPIPQGFDGIHPGDEPPEELDAPFRRRDFEPHFAHDSMQIGVGSDDDEVRDVAAGLFYHPHGGQPADVEDQLTGLEKQFTAAFGQPDETDFDAAWVHDAPIWREGDRVMVVGFRAAPEEAGAMAVIRPADPARPCGPEDGFDESLEGIVEAYENDDLDALTEYVADPLAANMIYVTEDGEEPEDVDDHHIIEVQSYEEFFNVEASDGEQWRDSRHGCAPLHGHHVLPGVGALPYIFHRDGDTWELTAIREWVAHTVPDDG